MGCLWITFLITIKTKCYCWIHSYWTKMYLQVLGSVYIIISFIVTHMDWAVLHNNFKLLLGNAVCLVQSCNLNIWNRVLFMLLGKPWIHIQYFVLLSLWLHLFVSWLAFCFFIPFFLLYFLQTLVLLLLKELYSNSRPPAVNATCLYGSLFWPYSSEFPFT
jgi:hypothetical protein